MQYTVVTAPASEPLTLAELKDHLRIDVDTEDAKIDALGYAARQVVEGRAHCRLVSQQLSVTLDFLPAEIQLRIGPVTAVDSIVYLDDAGNSSTLAASEYKVDLKNDPVRITPAYGKTWPSTYDEIAAVTVTFTVGYTDFATVPDHYKHAIKLLVSHWYENTEAVASDVTMMPVPMAVDALLGVDRRFEI